MTPRRFAAFSCLVGLPVGVMTAPAQVTRLVDVSSDGVQAQSPINVAPSISASGRFVSFTSWAGNLVPNDTNHGADVFVHDVETGETTRVSVNSKGGQSNSSPSHDTGESAISADGRFVAFVSMATDLVPDDTNGLRDIFVHDRLTGETTRVSVNTAGEEARTTHTFVGSQSPSSSAHGRYVAFESDAVNLVPNDNNQLEDVFVHDRLNRETVAVSIDSIGRPVGGARPSISATGRFVAFYSFAATLVPNDTNGDYDVFVHDLHTRETSRVSLSSAGAQGNGASRTSSISADGRFVAFDSIATNLVPDDTNGIADIFVHDRGTGETSRVSVDSAGHQASSYGDDDYNGSYSPKISADGRHVAFQSSAPNLVPDDTNVCFDDFATYNCADIFIHDRETGETSRVSVDSVGNQADHDSFSCSLSANGRSVAFDSIASNLVPNDVRYLDVFLRDRTPCGEGTVNQGSGERAAVLFINGSTVLVSVSRHAPIELRLDAPPGGPATARYLLWVWAGPPTRQRPLVWSRSTLGCTMNPTPIEPSRAPQPIRCVRGAGVPSIVCGGTTEVLGVPPRAPFTRAHRGFAGPILLTLQGVIEDDAASNSRRVSVTNAIFIEVE